MCDCSISPAEPSKPEPAGSRERRFDGCDDAITIAQMDQIGNILRGKCLSLKCLSLNLRQMWAMRRSRKHGGVVREMVPFREEPMTDGKSVTPAGTGAGMSFATWA
jgi:hypothetical protein